MFTYLQIIFEWVVEKSLLLSIPHIYFSTYVIWFPMKKKNNKYVYMIILPGEPSKRNIRRMTFLQTLWTSYETIVDTFQIEENLYLIWPLYNVISLLARRRVLDLNSVTYLYERYTWVPTTIWTFLHTLFRSIINNI